VRETLDPGVVVQAVADRHGVSTGQLYTWRRQMLATAMAGFASVEVAPDPPLSVLPSSAVTTAPPETTGSLDIVLPSGASIRVTGTVDPTMMRLVLSELGGR
jgi:transposase